MQSELENILNPSHIYYPDRAAKIGTTIQTETLANTVIAGFHHTSLTCLALFSSININKKYPGIIPSPLGPNKQKGECLFPRPLIDTVFILRNNAVREYHDRFYFPNSDIHDRLDHLIPIIIP